jgi:hypothetical protein
MMITQHLALLIGYTCALLGWVVLARLFPGLWPGQEKVTFPNPIVELIWAFVALIAVLGIGQLYQRDLLLPSDGAYHPALDAINQVIIFSPLSILLIVRRHGLHTAWLPTRRVWLRILAGLILALMAILAYTLSRTGSDSWAQVVPRVYQWTNFSFLIQVLLEDFAIAILFVRLRAVLGLKVVIVLVAVLFAAGHIPALIAGGAEAGELLSLFLDAGLGVLAISVLQRSADIWWFWGVHFAMDMMQFYAVP